MSSRLAALLCLWAALPACTRGPAQPHSEAERHADDERAEEHSTEEHSTVADTNPPDPLEPPEDVAPHTTLTGPVALQPPGDASDAEDGTVPFGPLGAQAAPTAADPLSEPTGPVADAQFVGRWERRGSVPAGPAPEPGAPAEPPGGGGGAIGWMRAYELRADGSFHMSAYPPLSLSGRWRRVGSSGARVELVHTQLRGPDGAPRVVVVRGLALPGEPLSFLEIEGERYPRETGPTDAR